MHFVAAALLLALMFALLAAAPHQSSLVTVLEVVPGLLSIVALAWAVGSSERIRDDSVGAATHSAAAEQP
jgi:hypothetical protein